MQAPPKKHVNIRKARIAFMACALCFAATCAAQQSKIKLTQVSSDQPLWSVNLHSTGYPNNPDFQRRRGLERFDTITFVSEKVLAASYVTREFIPDLQRRDNPENVRPYRLHAIFFDVISGKILHTVEWPIENTSAGIFPRFDGGFILFSTEHVVLYSSDWKQLKEVLLPPSHASGWSLGGIAASASGKMLVIQYLQGTSAFCIRIPTETLDVSQIPCGTLELFTTSDDRVVAPEKLRDGNDLRENTPRGAFVEYGASMPDGPPDPGSHIQKPDKTGLARTLCDACYGIPQFVNNDMIVLYSPTNISMVNRAGKVRFTQAFDAKEKWIDEFGRPVRSSANGQRFAIASNASHLRVGDPVAIQMSTGDLPAEFPLDIQVYDLPATQWIYSLQINTDHIHQIWGLALSPTGAMLAVDSGGQVQVYPLPVILTNSKQMQNSVASANDKN